jgi:uncharacterized protein (DUF58 family)
MFSLKQRLAVAYQRSLGKRNPLKKQQTLTQQNLFIFPSLLGASYLLLILILWLLGTNYNNNLILALAYLMVSIALISIFHTFVNMRGLQVSAAPVPPVYCGDDAYVELVFERQNTKVQQGVSVSWQFFNIDRQSKNDEVVEEVLDWRNKTQTRVVLATKTHYRGRHQPARLRIKSYYPLGLLKCWSDIAIEAAVIVYPRPVEYKQTKSDSEIAQSQMQSKKINTAIVVEQEFQGLKNYNEGEAMTHIAWKQYARSGVLYKKDYFTSGSQSTDLDWQHYQGVETEKRLQHLVYQAQQLNANAISFRLVLPDLVIDAGNSDKHLQQVLTALALFKV